jgi:hypothetical protein
MSEKNFFMERTSSAARAYQGRGDACAAGWSGAQIALMVGSEGRAPESRRGSLQMGVVPFAGELPVPDRK